jgi:UDP-3-O-[3-hydroxymyristoyl] N-acetylglucosamine deacetylase
VASIEKIGTVGNEIPRFAIWVRRPLEIRRGDKYAILTPSNIQRITLSIDFPGTAVGSQTMSVELVDEIFAREVAHARTFGFAHDLTRLRKMGLALGASLHCHAKRFIEKSIQINLLLFNFSTTFCANSTES